LWDGDGPLARRVTTKAKRCSDAADSSSDQLHPSVSFVSEWFGGFKSQKLKTDPKQPSKLPKAGTSEGIKRVYPD